MSPQIPNAASLLSLWEQSRTRLKAQFDNREIHAVFLEGSVAEGFGNQRSDIDFVAIIDNGVEPATMPYILFIDGRRIEVRLLSPQRLLRELRQVRAALDKGNAAIASLSWNLMERCQRFLGSIPIENEPAIRRLQSELPPARLSEAVALWFADFARQTGRYAVAMLVLRQPDYARTWIGTSVFHAAKSKLARLGQNYMGSKWLSLQLGRAGIEPDLVTRLWEFLRDRQTTDIGSHIAEGIDLMYRFGVAGVGASPEKVLVRPSRDVTTWPVGERVYVLQGGHMFALSEAAASTWRSIVADAPCVTIAARSGGPDASLDRCGLLADFVRIGLLRLRWKGGGEIRVRRRATLGVHNDGPIISIDGARMPETGPQSNVWLLPMPARSFAEVGVEMTWANIGLENAREDALGALQREQWQVLEYALQRMVQTACLVALAGCGFTPQPVLEEAVLETVRLIGLDDDLLQQIDQVKRTPIGDAETAQWQFTLANRIADALRQRAGEPAFPESFETATGWCKTILSSYDWINLAAHLNARFPQTSVGGHGTAEEARDILAASA